MLSELDRINFIVSELLILAKPQAVNIKPKNITIILESVLTLIESQAILNNIEIHTELEKELPPMNCEENQLKQVFINIIKNAIEAMPNGGSLYIRTRRADHQHVLSPSVIMEAEFRRSEFLSLGNLFIQQRKKEQV